MVESILTVKPFPELVSIGARLLFYPEKRDTKAKQQSQPVPIRLERYGTPILLS